MSNPLPVKVSRCGWAVLGMAAWVALAGFVAPAVAAEAPMVTLGKVKAVTDSSATIEFSVAPGDGQNLAVTVFYGREEGGELDDSWTRNTGPLKPDETKGPGQYTARLTGLTSDVPYFYRVKAASTAGVHWSELAEFHTETPAMPWYLGLLYLVVFAAMLAVPIALGTWLARRWRMPDYGWKLALILFLLTWSIYFVSIRPIKLGIDLSGGVVLIYELEEKPQEAAEVGGRQTRAEAEASSKAKMNKLIGAITLRVDPGGTRNVDIREYGKNQIEVLIPRANPDEVRRIREKISRAGTLVFRILADRRDRRPEHTRAIARSQQAEGDTVRDADGDELGWWVPVKPGEERDLAEDANVVTRTGHYHGQKVLKVLVVNDIYDVQGRYLSVCSPGNDERLRPCVNFTFNRLGSQKFGQLSGANAPNPVQPETSKRRLGIILDGYLYSAPVIEERIQGRGIIRGNFTKETVQDLVDVLNAGSLPATLKKNPVSEQESGPTLGRDMIQRGAIAIGMSLLAIFAFMTMYYRFAGMVASAAVVMNLLMLLAVMDVVKGFDLTLPGIAGLVLGVGMAVDANVLIFERIREELTRAAALRMAIRNGFDRALSVIIDSNLTGLITAVILYAVGTSQVKGFAVTLGLGIVFSLFTAVFCSRVVFDIGERRGWIKKLSMMQLIGATRVNFMGRMSLFCAGMSLTLIVVGLVAVGARGKGLLDIDFTGGESVQLVFKTPQAIENIRKILQDAKDASGNELFPDATVTDTKIYGEEPGKRFLMDTSKTVDEQALGKTSIEVVEGDLQRIFAENKMPLATNQMTIGKITPPGRQVEPTPSEPQPPAKPETPTPANNEQSRDDLPSGSLLALADPAAVLLAQGNSEAQKAPEDRPPSPPTPLPPAGEGRQQAASPPKATEAKPAEAKAKPAEAEARPAEAKPAETQPVEAKPAEQQLLEPEPVESKPLEPKPVEPKPVESKPAERSVAEPAAPAPTAPGRFAGRTRVNLGFTEPLDHETVKDLINGQLAKVSLSGVPFDLTSERYEPGDTEAYQDWRLWIELPEAQLNKNVLQPLAEHLATTPFFPSSSSVGGKVATDMQTKAIVALVVSWICTILYLWVRFQHVMYGLAAVVALVHDVLITLGFLAISLYVYPVVDAFKIGLTVLAAFLTIVGYSVNDTIVVFDRIREVKGKSPYLTADTINLSINQTLSRTLLTSVTVLLVVLILFYGGGSGLHAFAFTLLIGVITGTYSSIFVASPILYWMTGKTVGHQAKQA